jgi:hypothetical protein
MFSDKEFLTGLSQALDKMLLDEGEDAAAASTRRAKSYIDGLLEFLSSRRVT